MKRAILCVIGVIVLATSVVAQDIPKEDVKTPVTTAVAPSVVPTDTEKAALKKQNDDLKSQLAKATEAARVEQAKKDLIAIGASVKRDLGPICEANGGKWMWMKSGNTLSVGCVQK